MKRLALGIVGLTALLAAPAMAADLAARPAVKAVAPPPVFSWTGCYLGLHAGGGKQSSDYVSSQGGFGGVGAVGGAQAGCNLQWRQFVVGVEGEYWASGLRDRDFFQLESSSEELSSRNRWDAAISVRSGLAFERAFIYGKLGAVWGKFDYAFDDLDASPFTERGSATFTGVLIGAGFEYALTDNWTTKFEYNYIDYGNKIVDFTQTSCNPVCTTSSIRTTVKEVKQIAKVGVNYKF